MLMALLALRMQGLAPDIQPGQTEVPVLHAIGVVRASLELGLPSGLLIPGCLSLLPVQR